jgi:hypothetical protein
MFIYCSKISGFVTVNDLTGGHRYIAVSNSAFEDFIHAIPEKTVNLDGPEIKRKVDPKIGHFPHYNTKLDKLGRCTGRYPNDIQSSNLKDISSKISIVRKHIETTYSTNFELNEQLFI